MADSTLLRALALVALVSASPARADITVIVNLKNDAVLAREQVKNIFLARQREFSGGFAAKPVDQSEDAEIRSRFYLGLTGKDGNEMKIYWSNLIFTGNGGPPQSVGGDIDVKRVVGGSVNTIGYIDSKSVDATVRAILTVK
jgi:hypothetical protein